MSETPVQTPTGPVARLRTGARLVTLLAVLLAGSALLWHTTGDLDLLLHDRAGQDILDGQGVPRVNGYSFTAADHRWLDHEWLFQVAVAATGNLAGPGPERRDLAWRWLRLGLGLGLLLALGRDLLRHRRPPPWLIGWIGLLALAMLWTRLTLRPELISYLLVVLMLGRVEAALRCDWPRPSWRLIVDPRHPAGQATWLTLVWYQVHGFAALAPLLWLLAGSLDLGAGPWSRRRVRAAWGLLAALLVGMVTPNGPAGLLYPLQVLRQADAGLDLQRTISELVPLLETRGSLATTLLAFKVSLGWCVLWLAWSFPRVSWLRVALWLLALVAAWQGQRNLGLYAVTLVLLHGGPRDGAGILAARARRWTPRTARLALVLPPLLWLTVGLWCSAITSDRFYLREGVARRFGSGLTPANYPLVQGRLLAARQVDRVANTVDAASSLIVTRAGRVCIDGRTEAYPAAAWRDYATFKSGGPAALSLLARWRADAVCLAHRNPASRPVLQTLRDDPAGGCSMPTRRASSSSAADAAAGGTDSWRLAAQACLDELGGAAASGQVRLADLAVAWAGLLGQFGPDPVAEDLLRRAEQACPEHPVVLHNLGNLLLARGEHAAALRRFEAAARLNRNAAPPLVNAGACLVNLGRAAEAAVALHQAVSRDPDNFEGWANLAEVRRQLGDRDGAGAAYRRALELRPGDRRLRDRARSL